MADMIYCELLKLKRSKIQLIGILGALITPFLVIAKSAATYFLRPENTVSLFGLYDDTLMFLMLLFGPLVFTFIAAFLFSREYSEKTLKTIFTVPVSRKSFLASKFIVLFILVMMLMLISWCGTLILAIFCNIFFEIAELNLATAIFFLFKMILGGILVYATITPFVYLSIRTKGSLVPTIAIAAVALINVVITNSPVAGFYPWTASYLLLNGRLARTGCPYALAIAIIGLVFALSIWACMARFQKEDIV